MERKNSLFRLIQYFIDTKINFQHRSIFQSFHTIVVGISILITIILVGLNYVYNGKIFIENIKKNYNDIITKQFESIEYWLERRLEVIDNLTQNNEIKTAVKNKHISTLQEKFSNAIKSDGFYYCFFVADEKNRIIFSSIREAEEFFPTLSAFLQTTDMQIYNPIKKVFGNERKILLPISQPIYNEQKTIRYGILIGLLNLSHIENSISTIDCGLEGGVYIVDNKGKIIISTKPNLESMHNNSPLRDYVLADEDKNSIYLTEKGTAFLTQSIQEALRTHRHGNMEYRNHEGNTVLGLWKWYSYPQWMILAEIDKKIAYRSIAMSSLLFTFVGLFLLAIAIIVSKTLSKNFQRRLREFLELFGKTIQGNLTAFYPIQHNDNFSIRVSTNGTVTEYQKENGLCFFTIGSIARRLQREAKCLYIIEKKYKSCTQCYVYKYYQSNEINILGAWFNVLIEKLNIIIKEITSVADGIRHSSDDLAYTAAEFSSSTNAFASASEEIMATVEQLGASFNTIAERIKTQVESLNEITENMQAFSKDIDKLRAIINSAVNDLNNFTNNTKLGVEKLKTINQSIETMSESSKRIVDVLNIINDIAEKIHLLSLNASIEAARAGDAGKGFAVVAEEVGKLSDKTSQSLDSISKMIHENFRNVAAWKESMESVVELMFSTIEWLHSFQTIMNEINTYMEKESANKNIISSALIGVKDQNEAISVSIYEQKSATEEIIKSVASITEKTQEFAARSQQLAASSDALRDDAKILYRHIEYFTT